MTLADRRSRQKFKPIFPIINIIYDQRYWRRLILCIRRNWHYFWNRGRVNKSFIIVEFPFPVISYLIFRHFKYARTAHFIRFEWAQWLKSYERLLALDYFDHIYIIVYSINGAVIARNIYTLSKYRLFPCTIVVRNNIHII